MWSLVHADLATNASIVLAFKSGVLFNAYCSMQVLTYC